MTGRSGALWTTSLRRSATLKHWRRRKILESAVRGRSSDVRDRPPAGRHPCGCMRARCEHRGLRLHRCSAGCGQSRRLSWGRYRAGRRAPSAAPGRRARLLRSQRGPPESRRDISRAGMRSGNAPGGRAPKGVLSATSLPTACRAAYLDPPSGRRLPAGMRQGQLPPVRRARLADRSRPHQSESHIAGTLRLAFP